MRFVHLAPRDAIGKIRRAGIRKGGGRQGAGVYCVPLFLITVKSTKSAAYTDLSGPPPMDESSPLSSSRLWKHLYGSHYRDSRTSQPIALVFSPPPSSWPASVFFDVSAAMAGPLLQSLAPLPDVVVTDETRQFALDAAARGQWCWLEVTATTPNGLGLALNAFLAAGAVPYATYDEDWSSARRGSRTGAALATAHRAPRERLPWPRLESSRSGRDRRFHRGTRTTTSARPATPSRPFSRSPSCARRSLRLQPAPRRRSSSRRSRPLRSARTSFPRRRWRRRGATQP